GAGSSEPRGPSLWRRSCGVSGLGSWGYAGGCNPIGIRRQRRSMSSFVTRSDLIEVLKKWAAGALTAGEVCEWAGSRYLNPNTEYDDREEADPYSESVALEVLAYLDMLDQHLGLPEDVPIHLRFLAAEPGTFDAEFASWRAALDAID